MARKLNTLVLDDDPSIVRLLTRMALPKLGDRLEIQGLTDPTQALAWLDQNCCDILITDIEMPGVDGLEILRFAKARNAWTQVIFITAHSSLDRINAALEHGASDYLLKPIQQPELLELLTQSSQRLLRWKSAVGGTLRGAVSN